MYQNDPKVVVLCRLIGLEGTPLPIRCWPFLIQTLACLQGLFVDLWPGIVQVCSLNQQLKVAARPPGIVYLLLCFICAAASRGLLQMRVPLSLPMILVSTRSPFSPEKGALHDHAEHALPCCELN